jgi:regulator of nonsense transcripts 3
MGKFDGYVFVDSIRGSEYKAIVEYAPFQGLPKSRSRKTDKNMGTIESQQHFLDFLESLKNEVNENDLPKLEYSYKIKDEQKITSTPLLDYIHAKQQEKRDAKKKKAEEKRKYREEEKQKKKEKIAMKVPEPIKESKEETVYDDGVVVRTVPSRTSRNDKKKDKELKSETEKDKEKKATRKEKEEARRKADREKQKLKKEEKQREKQEKKEVLVQSTQSETVSEQPTSSKGETKRYSALRKARKEEKQEIVENPEKIEDDKDKKVSENFGNSSQNDEDKSKKEAREKEKQKKEDDRRARQIRNKDRPALQIYQPKRRTEDEKVQENPPKSSDEFSEANRKKIDKTEEKQGRRRPRKHIREEARKKKESKEPTSVEAISENLEKVKLDDDHTFEVVKNQEIDE